MKTLLLDPFFDGIKKRKEIDDAIRLLTTLFQPRSHLSTSAIRQRWASQGRREKVGGKRLIGGLV